MKTRIIALAATRAFGLTLATSAFAAKRTVVVWSEGTAPKNVYPNDINGAVVEGLASLEGWDVVRANLSDPDQGISDELLKKCDVLIWWGHKNHGDVKNELVKKIVQRVKEEGMGFISLHSSHFAKPNIALMSQAETSKEILDKVQPKGRVAAWGAYLGDSVTLKITVKDPTHPIAKGVSDFTIAHHERYNDLCRPDAQLSCVRRRRHAQGRQNRSFPGRFLLGNWQGQNVLFPGRTRDRPGVLR